MGAGSSRPNYGSESRGRSPMPKRRRQSGKKRRRGLLRKIRPVPTTQPIRYHSSYRYSRGSTPFVAPISPYAVQSSSVYPGYVPFSYNNYAAPYYMPQYQPLMVSPQQIQPMVIPQQLPQYYPMMMPQQVPQYQPMAMPQQVPRYQPMAMPQQVSSPMFSPYLYSPYSMGAQFSAPYVQQQQQQPQVQPVYNNIGVSAAPVSTGMTGQNIPYSSPYHISTVKITDWTGGGKISPGFLGPPI